MVSIKDLSFKLILILAFKSLIVYDLMAVDSVQFESKDWQYSDIDRFNHYNNYANQSNDADTILKYSQLALELAEELDLSPATSLVLKGNGFLQSGKITLAVECFTNAAYHYKKDGIASGLATVYTYISEAYIMQENHMNAKSYLLRAIDIFEEENDSVRLASALHNLGFEFYRVEQYDSALLMYAKSNQICYELGYIEEMAYCVGNSGLVYSKLNQLNKAETNLLQAIKTLNNYGDERAVADFINEYAFVLQREGRIKESIKSSLKSLDIANRNNITELKRDAAYRLAQIYEEVKQYDSALYYQLLYYSYNDSIRNLESIQKTADLRTKFEVDQKQAEVDILEKNRILQRTIIGGLFTIVLLAVGLIFMIYLSLRRNRLFTKVLEERKKQLEIQSRELRDLNHIKDRFFSIISHDLRSPIASLGGISFLIKESLESNNKAILNQATDYIDQSVVSLTGLLENLLNWALSQQGKFPFKEERIDLKELIEEVVRIFASVALSKNQTIELDLASGVAISADKNTMMTIIRNLLSNATKFTDKGGHILIKTRRKNGNAEIIISDEGIGIPEEKLNDLFKLKEDKSSRGTDNEKGLGLGLNLVYEFVEANNGSIRVESKVGEGTLFFLIFPRLYG